MATCHRGSARRGRLCLVGFKRPLLCCCLCLNIFHCEAIGHLIIFLLCVDLEHKRYIRNAVKQRRLLTTQMNGKHWSTLCRSHTCASLRSSFLRFCSAAALCFSHSSSFRRSCLKGHWPGIPGSFCFWAFLPSFLSSLAFFLWCSLTFLMTCAANNGGQDPARDCVIECRVIFKPDAPCTSASESFS